MCSSAMPATLRRLGRGMDLVSLTVHAGDKPNLFRTPLPLLTPSIYPQRVPSSSHIHRNAECDGSRVLGVEQAYRGYLRRGQRRPIHMRRVTNAFRSCDKRRRTLRLNSADHPAAPPVASTSSHPLCKHQHKHRTSQPLCPRYLLILVRLEVVANFTK
jgi:hypothetical protein